MSNVPTVEVYETGGPRTDWRYRVKAANGEILCQSEGYTTQANAERGVRALRRALLPGTRHPRSDEEITTIAWLAWKEGAEYANDSYYTPEEIRDNNPYN